MEYKRKWVVEKRECSDKRGGIRRRWKQKKGRVLALVVSFSLSLRGCGTILLKLIICLSKTVI